MDFNQFACSYGSEVDRVTAFSGRPQDYYAKFKAELILEMASAQSGELASVEALDVGCGVGITDAHLKEHFGHICGVDTSSESIAEAQTRNPAAEYLHYSGGALPYEDDRFGVTFAICVFHHVEGWDAQKSLLAEMSRVTQKGGLVLVFEHNPWNPLTRLVVSRCKLDQDATLLTARRMHMLARQSGLDAIQTKHILLTPWSGRFWRILDRWVGGVPFGAQYYLSGSPGHLEFHIA